MGSLLAIVCNILPVCSDSEAWSINCYNINKVGFIELYNIKYKQKLPYFPVNK